MLITQKNRLKLNKGQYKFLRNFSHKSKSLYNLYLYESKQHFANCGEFLNYKKAWDQLKDHPCYKSLPGDVAQQTMKMVERSWKSFFSLLKKKQKGNYNKLINEPHFLPKNGHFIMIFPIREGRCKKQFTLKVSKKLQQFYNFKSFNVTVPPNVQGHKIKEVRILPKCRALFFEIEFVYEIKEIKCDLNSTNVLSIDTGINNFATCLDSSGRSFILDGREMKSINRLYNKNKARWTSIVNKQNQKSSHRIRKHGYKKQRRLDEFLRQYVNFITQYCVVNKIGRIVIGEGHLAQDGTNLGASNNQNFVSLPLGKFCWKLKSKCEQFGIMFETINEAYTSKCDHLAGEEMKYHEKYLGTRIKRGLFKSSTGVTLNADVNGALGIMLKSGIGNTLSSKLSRGEVTSPCRIRLNDIQQTSAMQLVQTKFELTQAPRLAVE